MMATATHVPVSHANRGAWLEKAVIASAEIYRRDGTACVQKIPTPAIRGRNGEFIRTRSTVDFMGVVRSIPVAFDAKVTMQSHYEYDKRYQHQLDFLLSFEESGGVGALLIAFDSQGMFTHPAPFLVGARWFRFATEKTRRVSLSLLQAKADMGQDVVRIVAGRAPIHFAPAVVQLAGRA